MDEKKSAICYVIKVRTDGKHLHANKHLNF